MWSEDGSGDEAAVANSLHSLSEESSFSTDGSDESESVSEAEDGAAGDGAATDGSDGDGAATDEILIDFSTNTGASGNGATKTQLPKASVTKETTFQCDICKKFFKSKRILIRHLQIHTGEKPFKCDKCTAEFSRKEGLRAHQLIHEGKKPFHCKRCDYKSRSQRSVLQHQKIHDRGTVHRCSECEFSTMVKAAMISHLVGSHGTGKGYICIHCLFGFSSKTSLATHMEKIHPQIAHVCPTCGFRFISSSLLQRHMLTHSNVKPHKCVACNKEFTRAESLRNHMKLHEEVVEVSCELCEFTCTTQRSLNHHISSVHKKKSYKFQCSACEFSTFSGREEVASHISEKHADEEDSTSVLIIEDDMNQCKICDKTFSLQTSLKRHMLQHTGDAPSFPCPTCDRCFTRKGNLDEHMKQHVAKTLHCTDCDFKTISSSALSKHQQTLHGDTDFACSQCLFTCKVRDDLAIHMFETHDVKKAILYCSHCSYGFAERTQLCSHTELEHPDVKIYDCGECSEKFIRNSSYRRHVKTQHSTLQPYHCTHCDRSFNRSDKLKAHIKTHHSKGKMASQAKPKTELSHNVVQNGHDVETKVDNEQSGNDEDKVADVPKPATAPLPQELQTPKEQFLERFSCPQCHDSFDTSEALSAHVLLQFCEKKEETNHQCKLCNKTFDRRPYLLRHMRKKHKTSIKNGLQAADTAGQDAAELKAKAHICSQCGDTFSRNSALLRHMRSRHSTQKPYSCHVCDKQFTRNEALLKHLQAHEEGKTMPYQCDVCGHGFSKDSSLKKHRITHMSKAAGSSHDADVSAVLHDMLEQVVSTEPVNHCPPMVTS